MALPQGDGIRHVHPGLGGASGSGEGDFGWGTPGPPADPQIGVQYSLSGGTQWEVNQTQQAIRAFLPGQWTQGTGSGLGSPTAGGVLGGLIVPPGREPLGLTIAEAFEATGDGRVAKAFATGTIWVDPWGNAYAVTPGKQARLAAAHSPSSAEPVDLVGKRTPTGWQQEGAEPGGVAAPVPDANMRPGRYDAYLYPNAGPNDRAVEVTQPLSPNAEPRAPEPALFEVPLPLLGIPLPGSLGVVPSDGGKTQLRLHFSGEWLSNGPLDSPAIAVPGLAALDDKQDERLANVLSTRTPSGPLRPVKDGPDLGPLDAVPDVNPPLITRVQTPPATRPGSTSSVADDGADEQAQQAEAAKALQDYFDAVNAQSFLGGKRDRSPYLLGLGPLTLMADPFRMPELSRAVGDPFAEHAIDLLFTKSGDPRIDEAAARALGIAHLLGYDRPRPAPLPSPPPSTMPYTRMGDAFGVATGIDRMLGFEATPPSPRAATPNPWLGYAWIYAKAVGQDYLSAAKGALFDNWATVMTLGQYQSWRPGLALVSGYYEGGVWGAVKSYAGGVPIVGKAWALWDAYHQYLPKGWGWATHEQKAAWLGHSTFPTIGLAMDAVIVRSMAHAGAPVAWNKVQLLLEGELLSRGFLPRAPIGPLLDGLPALRKGLYYGQGQVSNPQPSPEVASGLRDRCVPACGQTLLRLLGFKVLAKRIWKAGGSPESGMTLSTLTEAVNELEPTARWHADSVTPTADALLDIAGKQGGNPWVAGTTYGEGEYHAVVVRGIDPITGEVEVLDPQPLVDSATGKLAKHGTVYRQTIEAFLLDWDGEFVAVEE